MTILICLPLILVIGGLAGRRLFVASRQDIRSIESHRVHLNHLEHLGPEETPVTHTAGSAHVRIVGQPADRPVQAVRPMVWGRPDGRPAAARPAWHSRRDEPVRTRYQKARVEAMERAEEQPPIVITDEAVAGAPDSPPERERRREAAAVRSVVPPRAAAPGAAGQAPTPDPAPDEAPAAVAPPVAEAPASARPEPASPAVLAAFARSTRSARARVGRPDRPARRATVAAPAAPPPPAAPAAPVSTAPPPPPAPAAAASTPPPPPPAPAAPAATPEAPSWPPAPPAPRPDPTAPEEVPGFLSALPAAGAVREPEAEGAIVIDDLTAGPAPSDDSAAVPEPGAPAAPAGPESLDDRRAGRRGPRVLAAAAAVLIVATGAGVAFHELDHSRPGGHVASPARAGGPSRPVTTVPPAPTVPPTLAATSASATEAVYTVTAGSLQVSVDASAPCWVELRSGSPSGPVVYEGTLQTGASQSFSTGNGLWMRLGNPGGVQMRINGAAVNLPAASNPFNITVTTA